MAHITESTEGEPGWPGLVGRLDARALGLLAPDFMAREVYCCGPAPYMAGVRALLDQAGFDRSRHHEESFSFEALPDSVHEEAAAAEAVAEATFSVTFAKSGKVVACPPAPPCSPRRRRPGCACRPPARAGSCGTCKSRMLSGRVDMRHGGGIRPREVDQGMVLICCSRPLEDLVIDR